MKTKHQITLTAEQAGEVLSPILSVVMSMDSGRAQYWIGRKKKLEKEVRKVLIGQDGNQYADTIQGWQNFWRKITDQEYNFSTIRIPERPEGKWRLLIIVDIPLERLYIECKKRFSCWRRTDKDFDEIVTENERDAKNGPYAIWVKDEAEADENLRNFSANDIKAKNLATETLAEKFIHELKFVDETGGHLDVKNITLCSGSRYGDGGVPGVGWRGGEMRVSWYHSGITGDDLRARETVS